MVIDLHAYVYNRFLHEHNNLGLGDYGGKKHPEKQGRNENSSRYCTLQQPVFELK
jgi:hypothetical protein